MTPCPRLAHNVRLTNSGQFGICGHMVASKNFSTLDELKNSQWLTDLHEKFKMDVWPEECVRCQEMEHMGNSSIREFSMKAHQDYHALDPNYMFVTGLLDNVCNAACVMCSNHASTYIGKLVRNVVLVDNQDLFHQLPIDKILVFEITGGEPSVSNLYKKSLKSLTNKTKYVRVNTNGSKFIPEIEPLLINGTNVTITLSIDGTHNVFEYIRWPLKWDNVLEVINQYLQLRIKYQNLKLDVWSSISALNIGDFTNIKKFSEQYDIPMSYALVHDPDVLNIKYQNRFTKSAASDTLGTLGLLAVDQNNDALIDEFIRVQDNIKKININDFITLP
jgi:sulfatase maturation enzyme AslB (radical SAM superfamily)